MELKDRKKMIVKAIVESYIDTAEPIGSKTLAEALDNAFSSATLRNEMSELEEMGFLEKPHVSAGRVPSYAAYRLYVNDLLQKRHALGFEIDAIRRELEAKLSEFDDLLYAASKVTSRMTNQTSLSAVKVKGGTVKRAELMPTENGRAYAAVLLSENDVKSRMIKTPFAVHPSDAAALAAAVNACIAENKLGFFLPRLARSINPEDGLFKLAEGLVRFIEETENEEENVKVHVEGAEKILNMREFSDATKARELMEYLSDGQKLADVLDAAGDRPVSIRIGPEIEEPRARDASIVFTSFEIDGEKGVVGIVAPTRMDYGKAIEYLSSFKQAASQLSSHKKDGGDK